MPRQPTLPRRSFQFAGAFVLLIVSAWFVDIFIMTFRVLRYLWGRFTKKGDQAAAAAAATTGQQKFALPLLAFPLMWLVVFVILVTVASVQGSRDPVTRTVEVRVGGGVFGEHGRGEPATAVFGRICSVPLLDVRGDVSSSCPIPSGVRSSFPIPFGGTFCLSALRGSSALITLRHPRVMRCQSRSHVVAVAVAVSFTIIIVPISAEHLVTSEALVQLTRTSFRGHRLPSPKGCALSTIKTQYLLPHSVSLGKDRSFKVFLSFYFADGGLHVWAFGLLSDHVPGAFGKSTGMPGRLQLSHGQRSACRAYRGQE